MIGADTDVLLRFLLRDDDTQSAGAERFFRERSAADPAFVSIVVLIELVWVLRRSYRLPRTEITRILRALLGAEAIVVQGAETVMRALRDAEESGADPADALIAHLGIEHGCDATVTFDRRATGLPGMLGL